ncbi:MAG TPA: LLM class flavin-dependent oxidoreductase, partial [Candidatus Acidoferrales bacterium]|nr:LLM class flavin-dependent oxidoreductase [Candidatus Acidoferrales bacterium]
MRRPLFGVHTGPQNCSYDDLKRVWHLADRSGFHWVSIWDHFYPAMLVPSDAQGTCFEAVSIMTALAAETKNVRVGSLVYCMAYRHPAVLANAMVTVDHVSGGRLELGLGAGWSQIEF